MPASPPGPRRIPPIPPRRVRPIPRPRRPESTVAPTAPPSTPAATAPADTGPPSATNKAEVYIVGDSDAGTFGPYLGTLLDGTNIVDTELNYKVSSGLARPDFFDWQAELAAKIPEVDPDIVVATFGGNDSQGLAVADGSFIVSDPVSDEADWTAEYRKRVGAAMDLMGANGATVIWVGIPNDDNPDVTAKLQIQDQAVRAEAALRDNVVFIDTWKRFSGRDGNWAEFVIDPRDGVRARTSAPTTGSTSTRTAPRSSPSTSPKPSATNSAPRAPPSDGSAIPVCVRIFRDGRPPEIATQTTIGGQRRPGYCCWPRAWMAARRAATWSGLNIVRRQARLSRASISHESSSEVIWA